MDTPARRVPGAFRLVLATVLSPLALASPPADLVTKEIIWQYGVTDTPGHAPGHLFYPDGFDLDVFRDWKAAAKP